MIRGLIIWIVFVVLPVAVLARFIARRLERREPQPRTLADALAEQNLPSNVVQLRPGPNRRRSA